MCGLIRRKRCGRKPGSGQLTELGCLLVRVSDTGIGIDAADHERIFAPFEQVGESPSMRNEGTGLGLSLTKRLVELQGGEIWVKSEQGKGSTFSFTLPLIAAAQPVAYAS